MTATSPALGSRSVLSTRYLVLWIYMLSLTLDFRRSDGDNGGLIVILGMLNLMVGCTLIYLTRFIRKDVMLTLVPVMVFFGIGIASGLVRGDPVYPILARSFPLLNFVVAILAIASYARNDVEREQLLNTIVISAIITSTWKCLFAFGYYGLDLQTARFQVLSGGIPLLFAYFAVSAAYAWRRFALIALVFSLGVVAISVTRSYLLVFAVSGLVAMASLPLTKQGRAMRGAVIGLVLLLLVIILISFLEPEVMERWILRLTQGSSSGQIDMTAATRLAEASYQLSRLQQDSWGLIFGFGQNAETRFIGAYAPILYALLEEGASYRGHGYGHNLYVGSLYVGGLVGGGMLIGWLFWRLLQGIAMCKRYILQHATTQNFTLLLGTASLAGFMVQAAFSISFGDRSIAFNFGITIGLILSGYKYRDTPSTS